MGGRSSTATYGPEAATRADAARASMRPPAVNADRTATAADREAAAEREMAAYESYWHAHGAPAYAPKGRDIMTIEGDRNAFWYDGEPVTPRRQAKQQEQSGAGMTTEENQFYTAAAKDPWLLNGSVRQARRRPPRLSRWSRRGTLPVRLTRPNRRPGPSHPPESRRQHTSWRREVLARKGDRRPRGRSLIHPGVHVQPARTCTRPDVPGGKPLRDRAYGISVTAPACGAREDASGTSENTRIATVSTERGGQWPARGPRPGRGQ